MTDSEDGGMAAWRCAVMIWS